MNRTLVSIAAGLGLTASVLIAADSATKPAPAPTAPSAPAPAPGAASPAASTPAPAAGATTPAAPQPSAEQVLNELLRRRSENPLIEPARPAPSGAQSNMSPRAGTVGTAPKAASQAALRREGQFIILRRGRMVRAAGDSSAWMLVFEADGQNMQEPPMYMMPCSILEDMESVVQQQGDTAVFTVSGQVFVYRGANYLLPTLMTLTGDHGNLKP